MKKVKFSEVAEAAERVLAETDPAVEITITVRLDGGVAKKFELLRQISQAAFGHSDEEFVAHMITAGVHHELKTLAMVRQETAGDA